jgi:hypothetical protein
VNAAGFGLLSYQLALQAIADLAARQGPGPGAPDTAAPATVDQEAVQTPQ